MRLVQWLLMVVILYVCNTHAYSRSSRDNEFVSPRDRNTPSENFSKSMTEAIPAANPTQKDESPKKRQEIEQYQDISFNNRPFRPYFPPVFPQRYFFVGPANFYSPSVPNQLGSPFDYFPQHDIAFNSNPFQFHRGNSFDDYFADPPQSYHIQRRCENNVCTQIQPDKKNKLPDTENSTPAPTTSPKPELNFHQLYDIQTDRFPLIRNNRRENN